MRKVEFLVGYYEYNVYVDNEHIFTFADFDDFFDNNCNLEDNLNCITNDSIEDMLESAKDDGFETNFCNYTEKQKELILSLTNEELEELKKQIYNVLKYKYE